MTLRTAGFLLAVALAGCAGAQRHPAPAQAGVTPPSRPAPTAPPAAPPSSIAGGLSSAIDAYIAQPRFAAAMWGIQVVSLDDGHTLYAHDAGKLFVPASNAKLYTATLALTELGADYRITTSLYATAAPDAHGGLDGDLILAGHGDPSLGAADVAPDSADWPDQFAAAVAAHGIASVQGDLFADATAYRDPPFGDGWEAGDLQSAFAAPATALGTGDNLMRVEVKRDGAHCCTVGIDPPQVGVEIVNLTGDAADADDLALYRPPGSERLYVTGSLSAGSAARSFVMAAPNPAALAARLLRDALERHGVHVHGKVRVLAWPQSGAALDRPGLQRIAEIASPPLADLVLHMLKHSDNLYAQHLLLQVGLRAAQRGVCADRRTPPRTTSGWGLCAMRAFLARIGIAPGAVLFDEGSGLSRKDLVTPAATTALLAWVERQPFASIFADALPVAGTDGTLRQRLRDTPADGQLRAKTGTLTHVHALSGYVTDAAGEHLAFSLMLNRYQRPLADDGTPLGPSPRDDLDAIAATLAENVGSAH